jgi:hypothetical protein
MDDVFRSFCQSVIDNIKKNGFPEKKVAFSLERMYALAEDKGVNFNKVLETLKSIEIEHQKTPEKIIFFPKLKTPPPQTAPTSNPFLGMDFSKMDIGRMMSQAAEMMKHMTPEQLAAAKQMAENMSAEERAELMRQAEEMGFIPRDEK